MVNKSFFRLTLAFILFPLLVIARTPAFPEEQQPDEAFHSYFARLTRGGHFPGIYLKAPQLFAEKFRQYIKKNYWMGPLEKSHSELINLGFQIWSQIYPSQQPLNFYQLSPDWKNHLKEFCDKEIETSSLNFKDWPQCLRRAFIEEILFSSQVYHHLSQLYGLSPLEVKSRFEIFLLNQTQFAAKLKEAGWEGPIYFRGATIPNPKNSKKRWILLNDDFLKLYTSFEYPIFQMWELAGIASHELSHVMQDIRGEKLNLNIEVNSAEDSLLIEGQAEFLNQKAFEMSGLFPRFFAREQAVEVINREGNPQSGNFFPYTIGLPFVTTIYDNKPDTKMTDKILEVLGHQKSLEQFLQDNYGIKKAIQ